MQALAHASLAAQKNSIFTESSPFHLGSLANSSCLAMARERTSA